ncbi:hypothetical protein ACO0K7_19150 [Undibacterium sp. Ji67W]|uniref:hypothetical protein n=1 Tax=Undibacterium sp. Ji67W TaxID=3413042 RepID=UPI003BF226D3
MSISLPINPVKRSSTKLHYFLFLLPVESLFYHLGLPVQSLWLIGVFSLLFLPLALLNFKSGRVATHVISALAIFFTLSIASFFYSSIMNERSSDNSTYIVAVFRNLFALVIGFSTFLFIRHLALNIGINKIFNVVLYSFIFVSLLAFLQVILTNDRANAYVFSEPSHLAEYISFVIFPVLMMQYQLQEKTSFKFYLLIGLSLMVFGATASGSGAIRLICVAIGYTFFSKARQLGFYILALVAAFGIYLYYFAAEDNYAKLMITYTLFAFDSGAEQTASVTDRGVLFLIFDAFFSIKHFLGFGFSAEATEFNQFMPLDLVTAILDVKQNGFSLSSLAAKILVAVGIPGLFGYFYFFWGRLIFTAHKFQAGRFVSPVLFAMCIYSTIGLPVYSDIYIWFWLGILEAFIPKENSRLE